VVLLLAPVARAIAQADQHGQTIVGVTPEQARPRTHDELATVIQGIWYVGAGARFDAAKLKAYPAGSFVMIPAGVPHFVATKKGPVIVQLNGTGRFGTDYLQK
jgi:quercetin dioxygenase-like cupin family protein